jgi:stearoyl-CoA desaturase (delta-9 desaturase)
MLYGLLNLSFWGYVLAVLILTQITVASITIYLHRCQAHRGLDLHPIASHFFRFCLWMTTGMGTKAWVAIHRKHHARCETAEDPHSPQILGIRKVFFEGAELYRQEAKNKETLEKYGAGTPNDWIERKLYTPFSKTGIALMFAIDILLFGIPGITVWAMQMLWTPIMAAGVINGIGHYWGYRNFNCNDASRNLVPWTFLACGEELHNNHHTFPTSAKLSVKWWEFDLGWAYICILRMLKLARVKRIPPELKRLPKIALDLDTLTAVITNHFQVMTHYTREVIFPVLKEEQSKASKTSKEMLKRARKLLNRPDRLLDESSKQNIALAMEKSQKLQLVCHHRTKLQDIWNKTTASQRELLESLQAWCKEAESAGVAALCNFAERLKGYSVIKKKA